MDEEERKGKWMMVSMLHSLQREMTYLLTCGRYSLVSDWLRAERSPVDEEEIKIKIDDGVARYFTRLEGNLFIC